ncbi:hypothetical protein HPB48_009522 [Haemaphysalis longicornis]|uniref:Nucleotide exchange factor Fes1 domain-containing protein n=1 Tax=Haemaphysalis longicornis TaxID=44386 RepID=A0A9J6GD98_HAELO|nr:hypothetical protein HPB48_009522 [Haemaphysalis longicornis]
MSGDDNPRNPKTLPALLNFCVQNTATQGAPGASSASIDPERKKWLEEAMASMTVSPVEEMQKNLKMIQDTLDQEKETAGGQVPSEETCSTLESAIENITEYVGSIDCAKVRACCFFGHLVPGLCQPPQSAWPLIAELVQNNPYCQQPNIQHLKRLLQLVDTAGEEAVRLKALYAVSCLVRHNLPAYLEFEKEDGFSVLLRALQSDTSKLKAKACFLLSSLCSQQEKSRGTLIGMGFVEQLAVLLQQEQGPHREHLLATLDTLVSECPSAREECRRPELHLEDTLRNSLAAVADHDEFREECEHCTHILAQCFADSSRGNPEMER